MSVPTELLLKNDYSNLIEGYAKESGKSTNEAKAIFMELMKFFWIGVNVDQKISPSVMIDDMWHYLLENETEYKALCSTEFGCYIDHIKSEKIDVNAYNNGIAIYEKIFSRKPSQLRPSLIDNAALCQPSKVAALCQPSKVAALCQPSKSADVRQPAQIVAICQPSKVAALCQPSKR